MLETTPAKLTVDGTRYVLLGGKIEKTQLGFEDHGSLVAWLKVEFLDPGVSSRVVGGHVLSCTEMLPPTEEHPYGWPSGQLSDGAYTGQYIIEILQVFGRYTQWERLPNTHLYVMYADEEYPEFGDPLGIASWPKAERVFLFEDLQKRCFPKA